MPVRLSCHCLHWNCLSCLVVWCIVLTSCCGGTLEPCTRDTWRSYTSLRLAYEKVSSGVPVMLIGGQQKIGISKYACRWRWLRSRISKIRVCSWGLMDCLSDRRQEPRSFCSRLYYLRIELLLRLIQLVARQAIAQVSRKLECPLI